MLHFLSVQLCICVKAGLIHVRLHKMYWYVSFKQEVLLILAGLKTVEIARIACVCITTCDFHSSLN